MPAPFASGHDDAVVPVTRAMQAELASVPRGSAQARSIDELGTALLRRATLDDEVWQRRQQHIHELRTRVEAILPMAPDNVAGLLDMLSGNATTLAARAAREPHVSEALHAIAAMLVETDLPEAAPRQADGSTRDESTAYQATPEPSVTENQLLTCLRAHAVAGVEINRITRLRVLSGGFSKEMLAATVETSQGTDEIVIRKVAPGRTAHTLGGEFATLTFAWQGGVPVAEPLWLDEDALGTPAFATRKADGRCLGDVWGPAEPVGRDTGTAVAAALARLHSLQAAELGCTPLSSMATRAEIVEAIEERQGVLDTVSDPSAPFATLFALVLGWLRAHAPGDVPRPVLVHGDFGLHNLLVDGTALAAVLDWERAHLGHAAEDLAYLRPSIEPVLPWEEFLEAYRAAGGEPPDREWLAYYTVWHDIWRGISAYRMRARFLADPIRISDAMAGLLMSPRFLVRAARAAFDL